MFTRADRDTIYQLRNLKPKPCEGGVVSALEWIGDRDEPVTVELWREFHAYDGDSARWVLSVAPLPATVLERLSEDADWRVRRAVVRNPSCPAAVLERLSGDKDWRVHEYVARNPSCPPTALERLSEDVDVYVREYVARNPSCPAAALERLSGDKDAEVRRAAKKTLDQIT